MIQPEPGRLLVLCHKVLSILSLPQSILANMLARAAASISDLSLGPPPYSAVICTVSAQHRCQPYTLPDSPVLLASTPSVSFP